jgi:cytochrome P450
MPLTGADPLRHSNTLAVVASEIAEECTNRAPYPSGEISFSPGRIKSFSSDIEVRRLLLDCYERFGPVFTVRILHRRLVFMLGPAANHYMTVSNASNFTIRESALRDIIDIIGDGILTTDGDYHRRMRRVVLPALQADNITSYFDTIVTETEAVLEHFKSGQAVDLHRWARRLILRIGMRTLFGFDPDGERVRSIGVMDMFGRLDDTPLLLKALPGRLSPWGRFMQFVGKLDQLVYTEIAERRAVGDGRSDVMSLLLNARDEDGELLSPRQIRDQVMTLLLSSGGTTTSTLCFFLYELARHPEVIERIAAEQRDSWEGAGPNLAQMKGGELVELEMALDETLRMYPATWIGPRRATDPFEFEGVTVPAGAYVNFCAAASHWLPEVFPEPERYLPERFAPHAKAALPKGAYVPFGGGSRTCIGMRLAQLELRTIGSLILRRFELEIPRDYSLKIGLMPMLRPRGGLWMVVHERAARQRGTTPVIAA